MNSRFLVVDSANELVSEEPFATEQKAYAAKEVYEDHCLDLARPLRVVPAEHCPFCDRDDMTMEHIQKCSGYKPSGMPPNETGHSYGCGCPDCMDEYRRLK